MTTPADPIADRLYRLTRDAPTLREHLRRLIGDAIDMGVASERKKIARALGSPRHREAAIGRYRERHKSAVFGEIPISAVPVIGAWIEYIKDGVYDE